MISKCIYIYFFGEPNHWIIFLLGTFHFHYSQTGILRGCSEEAIRSNHRLLRSKNDGQVGKQLDEKQHKEHENIPKNND